VKKEEAHTQAGIRSARRSLAPRPPSKGFSPECYAARMPAAPLPFRAVYRENDTPNI